MRMVAAWAMFAGAYGMIVSLIFLSVFRGG